MEFVLVTFPSLRPVRVDGARLGQTGQILRLPRGNHIFDLGNPRNYAPPNVQTPVLNTTLNAPMVIAFQPAAFAPPGAIPLAPPPPVPPAAAPRAAKKKGGRKRKKAGAAKKQKTGARKAKASAAKGGRRKAAKGGRRKVR